MFKHEEIKRERDKKRDRQTNRHIECEFWVDAVDNKVKLKFTLSIFADGTRGTIIIIQIDNVTVIYERNRGKHNYMYT